MPDARGEYLLAVDPGRDKCGLAVLNISGDVVGKAIADRDELDDAVRGLIDEFNPVRIAVGDGTGSLEVREALGKISDLEITVVSERDTTLEARELAWRERPPRGLWRFLPKIFWPTPTELDAWAAVVIGRRALGI
jgi:RNase H-fold protein (predicted Holliday junction resolvase)